ncbi:unnamed protein product [Ectocarpus fasciculatus]
MRRDKPAVGGGGLKFHLKGKTTGKKRAPPPLPPALVEAAAVADAKEEKLVAAAAAAAAANVSEAQPMDVDGESEASSCGGEGSNVAAGGTKRKASSPSPSSTPDPPAAGGGGPVKPAVSNRVRRVKLSCSKPLLANDGKTSGAKLERAVCSDPRLVKMRWDGGLVMVSAVVKDAAGGKAIPDIDLTQSPSGMTIEALGAKIRIAAPPEAKNKDGFSAACGGAVGVNSVRRLRGHLQKLDGHIDEHARGGDEGLRWVDNLKQKRTVLRQVGAILDDEFRYLPALGGLWMRVRHLPSAKKGGSGVWNTGSATPTIEFRVLMRRARLANEGGLTVEEDARYAEAAAAAAAAAAEAQAAEVSEEDDEEEEADAGRFKIPSTPQEYMHALEERIYNGYMVHEVVSRVVDRAVHVAVDGIEMVDAQGGLVWPPWSTEECRRRFLAKGAAEELARRRNVV